MFLSDVSASDVSASDVSASDVSASDVSASDVESIKDNKLDESLKSSLENTDPWLQNKIDSANEVVKVADEPTNEVEEEVKDCKK